MKLDSDSSTVVLLVNLGTPNQPNTEQVRIYLREFLSDKDVIRLPRIFWLPLLHLIILRVRPAKSAALYRKVWTEWGSPLLYNSFLQCGKLREIFKKFTKHNFSIDVAMRYGKPSIEKKLIEYHKKGFKKVLILPMFPQYSTTTAKSIANKLKLILKNNAELDKSLDISFIKDFHDNPKYIKASANHIRKYQVKHGQPQKLLFSFHGIPKSYVGDDEPYQKQCLITANLIAEELGLAKEAYNIVFQSRFGKAEWIQPYLAQTLESYPGEGVKDIQVFCPGFVADCLETIEEIGQESRDLFIDSGGLNYHFIPCLNDDEGLLDSLKELIINYNDYSIDYNDLP